MMMEVPMTDVIAELARRLALPPDGIDLRAELVALQSARIRQALDLAGGDYGRAARLLRMSRLDLARLETRLESEGAGVAHVTCGASNCAGPHLEPRDIPRIANGVEMISAKAIRTYAAEGLGERAIARRLGCNVYVVEKVLREQSEAEIVRLDREEKLAPNAIAERMRVPRSRVRQILKRADACAPRKLSPE